MSNVFDLILYGFQSIMNWCSNIEYMGINVLQVCFFAFFISLVWGLILAPIIGNRSGSLSLGVSEMRSMSQSREDRRNAREVRQNQNSYYKSGKRYYDAGRRYYNRH